MSQKINKYKSRLVAGVFSLLGVVFFGKGVVDGAHINNTVADVSRNIFGIESAHADGDGGGGCSGSGCNCDYVYTPDPASQTLDLY